MNKNNRWTRHNAARASGKDGEGGNMAPYIKKMIFGSGALAIILVSAFFAHDALAASTWLSSISADVPTRIALDAQGNIYVTEARDKNLVRVFDRRGKLLRARSGFKSPAGIAVDGQSRLYVVNAAAKSVDVYNGDFTPSFSLGAGKGEFKAPASVAVGANGLIYVADTKDNRIKAYNPNGTPAFAFGGWGKGNGQFNEPRSLAIDESKGEIYVADFGIFNDPSYGDTAGARVQVFDLQGGFKRSFGTYGTGEGKMIRPVDIALDRDGRVYVVDSFQGVIHVFDGYGAPLETIFDAAHPTKIPIGIAVGKDNRVFVATSNKKNVDVFGMAGYTTLDVTPASLTFTSALGSGNPPAQTLTVGNSGTGTLDWTAAKDKTWVALAQAGSALSVGVNVAGLAEGAYDGTVTVTASTGATETIPVRLNITPPPAALAVTPAGLAFKAQQNGAAPPAQTIDIRNMGGGAMTWTAAKTQTWLTLNAASGAAPSQVLASVAAGLPTGTYSDTVTITAPGAQGSPAQVSVSVTVSATGTVTITTNLSQAQFTVTGPAPATTTYPGSGTLWKNEDLAPGEYAVSYNHVSGYRKPAGSAFTITTGKETAISAEYAKKAAMTHVVAVTGTSLKKKVTVMTLAGEQVASFKPFAYPVTNVQAAAGDLDGSGVEKLVVTDGVRSVKVYGIDGTELATAGLPKWNTGAVLAVGDINGDGKAEVVVGSLVKRLFKKDLREVRLFAFASGKLEGKGMLFTEEKSGAFSLAAGDVNSDAGPKVIMADKTDVRAFSLENGLLAPLWSVQGTFAAVPEVATGDLDDDGAPEIALSEPGVVHILRSTGEPTGALISTPKNRLRPDSASVAIGDVDGDGADEIAVGSPVTPTVQMYKGDGTALGAPLEVKNAGSTGVNVGLGRF